MKTYKITFQGQYSANDESEAFEQFLEHLDRYCSDQFDDLSALDIEEVTR